MAYDPLNPKDDEEKADGAEQSQYAGLLAGPTAGASAGPAATAAKPTPAPTRGFVNFDRILNANRSTVDGMKSRLQSTENGQQEALRNAAIASKDDFAARAKDHTIGPAQGIAPTAEAAKVNGEIANANITSYADAQKNALKGYAGPTQSDVGTKYASLFANYNGYKNNAKTPTGLDGQLLQATGGVDTSGRAAAESDYAKSFQAANDAVLAGQKDAGQNQSAWSKLLADYEVNSPQSSQNLASRDNERAHTQQLEQTATREIVAAADQGLGGAWGDDIKRKASKLSAADKTTLAQMIRKRGAHKELALVDANYFLNSKGIK